ncbi:hypothetical protein ACLBR5_20050 [Escherichia coli]
MLDWRKGECDLIPGKTAPNIVAVERDYPATYERFTSLGPLMEKLAMAVKGFRGIRRINRFPRQTQLHQA